MAYIKYILTHIKTGLIFKCKDALQCANYLGVSRGVIYAKLNGLTELTLNGYKVEKVRRRPARPGIFRDEFGEYKELLCEDRFVIKDRIGKVNKVGTIDISKPFEFSTADLSSDVDTERYRRYREVVHAREELDDFKKAERVYKDLFECEA